MRFFRFPTAMVRPLSSLAKFSFVISNMPFPQFSSPPLTTAPTRHFSSAGGVAVAVPSRLISRRRSCTVITSRNGARKPSHDRNARASTRRLIRRLLAPTLDQLVAVCLIAPNLENVLHLLVCERMQVWPYLDVLTVASVLFQPLCNRIVGMHWCA